MNVSCVRWAVPLFLLGGCGGFDIDTEYTIQMAAEAGDAIEVAGFLAEGGDPDEVDPVSGSRPLIAGALIGSPETVEVLLEFGADPNSTEVDSSLTPLSAAASRIGLRGTNVVELLLDAGADPCPVLAANDHRLDWGIALQERRPSEIAFAMANERSAALLVEAERECR